MITKMLIKLIFHPLRYVQSLLSVQLSKSDDAFDLDASSDAHSLLLFIIFIF